MIAPLAFLLAAAQAADRAPDPLAIDLRCLIVTSAVADKVPEDQKNEVVAVAIYYLGRVNGRAPDLDLRRRAVAEAAALRTLGDQGIASLAQSCGREMQRRGLELDAAGRTVAAAEAA